MLSYRHAFHAGNFADVLKHSVLTLVLDYMTRKDKGYSYIDSHSGAGLYQLEDEYAQKTGEYKDGIAKLIQAYQSGQSLPEALHPYIELILSLNKDTTASDGLSLYPGSPGIAKQFSRRQDSAHLFDLHPTDIGYLSRYCERWSKSFVKQSDGYQGVLSLLPPPSRRAVVLIDPPYELKEDYVKAVKTLCDSYRKFATGTYILWYPVVKRALVDEMVQRFMRSQVKNLLQVEFCQRPDTEEYGMTGTGLFIINPPWQLAQQLEDILPYMQQNLGQAGSRYRIEQLIAQ